MSLPRHVKLSLELLHRIVEAAPGAIPMILVESLESHGKIVVEIGNGIQVGIEQNRLL
jgi:protein-L-isoaspartate O-methyltransferase